MDLFSEYVADEDEALHSFIREKSSPTEVTVILNNQDWEQEEKEEIFTVTKETTSSVAVIDVPAGEDPNAIPLVERNMVESKETVVLSGDAAKAALVRSESLDKPKPIADASGEGGHNVKGLVSYFTTAGAESSPPDDTPAIVHPSPPPSALDDEVKTLPATAEINVVIGKKDSDSSSSSSDEDSDSDSDKKVGNPDASVVIYETTPSAVAEVDVVKPGAVNTMQFHRSTSSSTVKKEQGQKAGGGSFMHYESTTSSSSTTVIAAGDGFTPGIANMIPPSITWEPKGEFTGPPEDDDKDTSGATDEKE